MKPEVLKKIQEDEDFIHCPKMNNSIKEILKKNPDGLEDKKIADLLCMQIDEIEEIYQSAIKKLRQKLNIKV